MAAIGVFIVGIATSFGHGSSEGAVGVALVNLLTFNQNLALLVQFWTQLETRLGAIARVTQVVRQTIREETKTEQQSAHTKWPWQGHIESRHVTATVRWDFRTD